MTEQEKREKVIEALEACVLKDPDDSRDCKNCPRCNYGAFITNSCINGVMVDAQELLKAQEPRVLTDADFINNPNCDSKGFLPAWIEYRRDTDEWAKYWQDDDDEWTTVKIDNYKGEGYRCWTSKPSEEQRKAVAWE